MDKRTAEAIALAHRAMVELQRQQAIVDRLSDDLARVLAALDDVVVEEYPMLAAEVVQFPVVAS